jgi:uncharacterized protein YraI
MIKKIGILVLLFIILITSQKVFAVSIDDSHVFVKQSSSGRCTHASAVNMFRRRAIIDGKSNWESITESSTDSSFWLSGAGLYAAFTYDGVSASRVQLNGTSDQKKSEIITKLNEHPEGIVGYHYGTNQHAVLITSYNSNNDTFYCYDPAGSYPSYIIPLTSAYLPGSTQSETIADLEYYWYITNRSGGGVPISVTPTAVVNNGKVSLSWSNANNATLYNVRIFKDYAGSGTDYSQWSVIEQSLELGLPVGTYYVYIDACNDNGYSTGGTISFTVNQEYSGPWNANLQVSNTDNSVNFSWNAAKNAAIYNLRIKDEIGTDYTKWNITDTKSTVVLPLGKYTAYIDSCKDGWSATKGKSIAFEVTNSFYDVGAVTPTAIVNNGKVSLNWNNGKNATFYNVRLFKDYIGSGTDYSQWNVIEQGLALGLHAGTYYVYIDACNEYAYKAGNTISFNVSQEYQGPWHTSLQFKVSDNNVTFTWAASKNTDLYNLRIKNDKGTDYTVWNLKNTTAAVKLLPGNYSAYIDSCKTGWSATKSKTIKFTVTSQSVYSKTTISQQENDYNFSVAIANPVLNSAVILTTYTSDNRLAEIKRTKITSTSSPILLSMSATPGVTNAKVMVWEGLGAMQPLCEPEIIPLLP